MFMCTPVEHFWNPSVGGTCMNPKIVYFTNAPFNILTDFVLLGFPLPILWKLQLPRRQRIGLVFLFAIGIVYVLSLILIEKFNVDHGHDSGCLTSILRLRSLYYLSISTDITRE